MVEELKKEIDKLAAEMEEKRAAEEAQKRMPKEVLA